MVAGNYQRHPANLDGSVSSVNSVKVPRRTLVQGAVWAVPATVVATAAPAFAASGKRNPLACSPAATVPTREREPKGWEGPSVRLRLARPVSTPINGALFDLAAPPSLTIANVGPTTIAKGTVVELSAWKLDGHGIVDKNAPAVVTTRADSRYLAPQGVATSNTSRFTLVCDLEPYQQISVNFLGWSKGTLAIIPSLTSVQFLARIILNSDPLEYTEFQSPEVIGGAGA